MIDDSGSLVLLEPKGSYTTDLHTEKRTLSFDDRAYWDVL